MLLGTLCTSQYSQTPVYQIPATMGADANNWRSPTCVCVLTTGKEGTAHNVWLTCSIANKSYSIPLTPPRFPWTAVIRDQAPEIQAGPQNTFQKLYSMVNLTCIATGTPEPSITWYKDGTRLPNQQLPFLLIPELQLQHRGLYHCEASNQIRFESDPETLHPRMAISHKAVVNIEGELPCPWWSLENLAGDWSTSTWGVSHHAPPDW